VPKLKEFTLKSIISNDFEFSYLKWLLNNVNYVKKLEIYLYLYEMERTDQMICRSFIDANFIRQYCLPDKIINLDDFRFYIRVKCNLSLNDVEKIVNSFQINSFFIAHQWTNVKCVYDENESYQHLFSSNLNKFQHFHRLFNNQFVSYDLSNTRQIEINFDPSLDLFLKQFDELYPQVSSMKIPTGEAIST
ncbi:unnamed protein product, partial [Rotaria sordida]